jgi:ATP-dependent Clp protease ATP-binding subunit ClpX
MVHDLLYHSQGNVFEAERGVLFVDEIDKLSTYNTQGSRGESFNSAIQSTLLKLIEGKRVKCPLAPLGEPQGSIAVVETTRMLFMFGGAFYGLAEQVAKEMGWTGRSMSFIRKSNEDDMEKSIRSYEIMIKAPAEVIVKALVEHGMNAEFVGRIPILVPLAPLNKDELRLCLFDMPHSPVPRAQTLFAESEIALEFDEEFVDAVIEKTIKTDTGTRALHSFVKRAISKAAFDFLGEKIGANTGKHIVITKACLDNPAEYRI